ncbi:MAG: hypothetical protein JW874_06490 [Spirochaetales bacterium]|nr:hypothetical protein [Spirochaetales bacterium]
MKKIRFLLIVSAMCFLLSCRTAVHDFPFLDLNKRSIELNEYPGIEAGNEGRLLAGEDGYSTPLYKLKKHIISLTGSNNASFFLIFTARNEITINFYFKETEVARKRIPAFGVETEYIFPLDDLEHFDSFRLFSDKDAALKIKCLGLIDETVGVEFGNRMRITEGYEYNLHDGSTHDHEFRFFTGSERGRNNINYSICIEYKTVDRGIAVSEEKIALAIGDSEHSLNYVLTPKAEGEYLWLYRGMFPFAPEWVKIRLNGKSDISLASFTVFPVLQSDNTPLPADFLTILENSTEFWRQPEYELYSWSRFPEVLVFDFIDYTTQARFLKRLAFYVEKRGYAGTVHSNEVIGPLHGWNAHDYRPSDIADFFNKAAQIDFKLNPEEIELRNILLKNGIIAEQQNMYYPGKGAVISISRETTGSLRKKLLTHEGSHGIVFVRPEYFEMCTQIWNTLTYNEQDFWRLFLAHNYYNINDPYLVVNEFQAYMVQQPRRDIFHFFAEWKGPDLAERYPAKADMINSLLKESPERFLEMADAIDAALYSVSGCRLGDLSALERIR